MSLPTHPKVHHAESFSSLPVLTLREIAMVDYMEDITDIPEWWKKVSNLGTIFNVMLCLLIESICRSSIQLSRKSGRRLL